MKSKVLPYTVNIKVVDQDNNPISGAKVCLDHGEELNLSTSTKKDGSIPTQVVIGAECFEDGTINHHYPFKFVIRKEEYETKEIEFGLISEPIDWVLVLKCRTT